MKKIFSKILFFLPFLFIFLFLIYHYRYVYLTPFDEKYSRDLFDHSQYRIPRSPRSISDELLYQVAGVDYLKTGNPFDINPEAPPLAKYLYGLSIKLFNNPQVISIFIFSLTFFFFFQIANLFFKSKKLVFFTSILFLTEPLIYSQIGISMLDLPQLLFFLIHIYSFFKLVEKENKIMKSVLYSAFTGISLGGFISTKFGMFAIIIIAIELLFVSRKNRLLFNFFLIILFGIFTYFVVYLPFFLKGGSLIDFLKAQKWIVNYWKNSYVSTIPGQIFIYFLIGFNKGWYEGAVWERIPEWTIFWPIYIILFLIQIRYIINLTIKFIRSQISFSLIKELYINLILLLLIFSMIPMPVFVRYLLLILPLLILITVKKISELKKFNSYHYAIFAMLFIIYFIQQIYYLNPPPKSIIKEIVRQWEKSTYQDMYNYLSLDKKYESYDFWQYVLNLERKIYLVNKKVDIITEKYYPWKKEVLGTACITYNTKIGTLNNIQPIKFIKKNNQWYLKWNSTLIFNKFDYDDKIISNLKEGYYGKIALPNNKILSGEGIRPFFLIQPNLVKNDRAVQQQLQKLTDKTAFQIEIAYRANALPNEKKEIGFLKDNLNENYLKKIELESGIVVEKRKTRVYYPNKQFPLDLIKKIELQNYFVVNPITGGSIKLLKKNQHQITLLERQKKDGKDIVVNM